MCALLWEEFWKTFHPFTYTFPRNKTGSLEAVVMSRDVMTKETTGKASKFPCWFDVLCYPNPSYKS